MPTGENTEPAGGRVTRSLRKRLTSTDNDVPSRPGTPSNIILQSIPETNTPKKRVTRRASLSTPSALTPTIELTITPGRRVTRRRSVNFSESDEQSLPIISKEPTVAVVKEEEPEIETPNEKPKRVLRSSSKSPDDAENKNKNKQSSKKTSNQEEQVEQEDIIVLDDTIENLALKQTSAKKKTKVNGSTPTKKSENLTAAEKNNLNVKTPSPNRTDSENIDDKKGIESPVKSASKRDSLRAQLTPETSKSDKGKGSRKKSKSAEKDKQLSNVKSSPLIFEKIETSPESPSKKNLSKTAAEPGIRRLSTTKKNQSSPAMVKPSQNCPLKKNHPEPLKNVAFNEAADENSVKNVYPKTPGLIKSKSYILDESNDFDKNETFKSKKGQSFEDNGTNSDQEETASPNTKTPYKLKLMAVGSSTPIQNSSPKKQKSAKENLMTEEGVVAFPSPWNKSVSGIILETSKIDCIPSEKSLEEKPAQVSTNKSPRNASQNSSKNKSRQDDSDVSETEDDMLEEDDDEFNDEEEKGQNAEKTIFLDDDEAAEVADGEGPIDSEENKVAVESSKPIPKSSPKQNKTSKVKKQKGKLVEFGSKNKSRRDVSDVSEAEDDMLEEDDNELSDDEERGQNAEKTIFLDDDEAIEVAKGEGPIHLEENKVAVESSKPIQKKSPKQNKTSKVQKQKGKLVDFGSKNKSRRDDSDVSEAEDDMLEEDDVELSDDEEKGQNAEKTIFLDDDEAIEVAKGEGPMDSEENKVAVESSKPISKSSPKQNKTSKVKKQKGKLVEFGSKNKSRRDDSDVSETEDDMLEEDDDELSDDEEKGQNAEKTIFLDDDEVTEVAKGEGPIHSEENKVAVESSKPIKKKSPKQNKSSKVQKQTGKLVEFGTIRETSKIDCIQSEKSLQEQRSQKETNKSPRNASQNSSKNKSRRDDSDASEAEGDLLEGDDNEFSDEEEKNQNAEKTIFLDDDEAMDVADGEGPINSEENQVSVESSKPIHKSSPKQNKTSKIQEQKDKSVKENLMTEKEEEKVVAFPTSWSKSVSGTIREISKIDSILSEKSLQEKREQKATHKSPSNVSQNSSKKKVRRDDSDVSEDDMLEEGDDEFNDEEEADRKARKSSFLDDEAMEVADGEESMDSEERAYLEENEVPEYGESIGSQDSEDDDNCDDEEPDEEDAAFVVSDTEVIEEFLSSEDELETSKKKKLDTSKQKKYKRICQQTESSDEELNPFASKDDTDFCLLVDSSLEEKNTENAKQSGNVQSPRKSLNNKANDSDMKTKSFKDKSLKEDIKQNDSKIDIPVQEDVSDKENETEKHKAESSPTIINENNNTKKARKSKAKNDADIENSPSKEKPLKKEKKLNSSKLNQTVQDNDSDIETEEKECTEIPQQNKAEISENDEFSHENEQEPYVLKSYEKKKLTKSPKQKSVIPVDPVDVSAIVENLNDISRKSLNEKNNSLRESKSPSRSTKRVKKVSTISVEDSDDVLQRDEQEPTASKSTQKKRLTKSPKRKSVAIITQVESEDEDEMQCNSIENSRKSVNKSIVCDDGFEPINEKSLNKSRKSVSESIDAPANEETLDFNQRKSIDNSNSNKNASLNEEKDNSKGRKSLNESRKSLIRTSTEETNDPGDQSTAEKNKLLLEETLSASENQLDTSAGKTLNKSKDLRKSFDRNSSLQNEQFNQPEKSKRRKSIAQQSVVQKSSESSADSEDENTEKLPRDSLKNKQFNEPEKSKRRKSIAQQSFGQKSSESSADSEDENKDKLPRDSLQNKQFNEPEIAKRRKSIAQQSIIEKPSESSADSENENNEKSSPEITDNEMESSHDEAAEAQFSDEESVATSVDKSESSLKQNSSRRKSIVTNESKLDETFQLDPKSSLSSSLHDSLHRTILRKSLNQSQKRKETIEQNTDDIDKEDNPSTDSEDVDNSSEEEEFEIKKKTDSEKGLSVSLNAIQIKKKKLNDAKAIRNSFTIGVTVRKNFSKDEDSSESEPVAENVASSEEGEDALHNQDSSSSESKLLNLSEENILEKVKDCKQVGPYKSRKSMSNSILLAPPSDGDINKKKRIKRTSLYLQEEAASNSFVENLAEEKKKIKQQKRKSNSFCGVIAPSAGDDDDDDVRIKEPRSEKKQKKSSFESEDKKDNLKHVLSRCEQMIEAANEAKLKAKLQAKKVKVKKPKWMDKEEEKKARKEEDNVEIPLVSKKEIKRKEKIKKELAKALKQSASVLSKSVEPVNKAKQKNAPSKLENYVNPSKRLETEFLESLMELTNPKKKKTKEIETTPPSDKENSKKKSNKSKKRIEDIHKKIESDIETLETACGTVIVEPSTPQKLRFQHGFRESPKTPIGFKIQNLDSTDKKADKKCSRKLKSLSGAFIEEDLTTSKKTNSLEKKARKRKLPCIEEPIYTLPKTQWTPSGVFVEEDLSNGRPLANSTATQFLVASLNSSKKNKTSSEVISSTALDKALSFKQNALQRNNLLRQASREILHVKHRKFVNSKF